MAVESETYPRAEETLRLLAAAAGCARLYPPSSALPAEAVAKFTRRSNEVTGSQGPLRYSVDPDGFHMGDADLGGGNSQVVALAKSLHSLQVGQVVIAPGLTDAEAAAFVTIANAEPAAVRAVGGPRTVLGSAHVAHIAVVEVSLRASDEDGLLGMDLMAAPLDDIAGELEGAAEHWAESANGAGDDQMAAAADRLETATRDIAIERVSAAMMRLDEKTRMKVLAQSLRSDSNGRRMDGMLDVIAHMKPASLARLLTLVAEQAGTDPKRIAAALPLTPEIAKRLRALLAPMPLDDPTAPQPPSARELAADMALPPDEGEIARQVAVASPQLSAGRALGTAVAITRAGTVDIESVRAIGDTLPQAARDGSFPHVREALRRLDELGSQPELTVEISQARAVLSDPNVLADVCAAVATDADAAIAGEILHAAGAAGADALLETYIRGTDVQRSLLRPALRGMSESILGVARTRLRNEEPRRAVAILAVLAALGDRRAIPVMTQALAHLEERVRFTAITSLADTPEPEAANALIKALNHPEPETQRFAVREIGRVKAAPAVHQLTRALEDINVLQRTYETKKEVIRALEQIATPEAQHALRRTADRGFVWGRKGRELRTLARRALEEIDAADYAPPRGVE
ncbi:MAG: HEAT repeat domain-containing protein [Coriobacteriia bacterium]|nr:HEAT repeat domain-containing protein [Coriobacteriia bacterium]